MPSPSTDSLMQPLRSDVLMTTTATTATTAATADTTPASSLKLGLVSKNDAGSDSGITNEVQFDSLLVFTANLMATGITGVKHSSIIRSSNGNGNGNGNGNSGRELVSALEHAVKNGSLSVTASSPTEEDNAAEQRRTIAIVSVPDYQNEQQQQQPQQQQQYGHSRKSSVSSTSSKGADSATTAGTWRDSGYSISHKNGSSEKLTDASAIAVQMSPSLAAHFSRPSTPTPQFIRGRPVWDHLDTGAVTSPGSAAVTDSAPVTVSSSARPASPSQSLLVPATFGGNKVESALEHQGNVEITAKLFLLNPPSAADSGNDSARFLSEGIAALKSVLGVSSIDTFVLSFAGQQLSDNGEDTQGGHELDISKVADLFKLLSKRRVQGDIRQVGVADFSADRLEALRGCLANANATDAFPALDQVNLSECCSVSTRLIEYGKTNNVRLLAHSDDNSAAILTSADLNGILAGQSNINFTGAASRLEPQWILKYTVLLRDRGIVANKGYVISAQSSSS